MITRFEIVRSILLEKKASGEKGFDLRRLAIEVEHRYGKWICEDTVRKEADLLKPEIPFVKAGVGVRRFVVPEQQVLFGDTRVAYQQPAEQIITPDVGGVR